MFFSETTRQIGVKFDIKILKFGANGLGHMIKMTAILIYGKTLSKSSSLDSKGQ